MWKIAKIYLGVAIDLFSVFLFGKIVFGKTKKVRIKKQIFIFLIFSIIQTVIYIYSAGTLKSVLMFLSNILYNKYNFTINNSKSILLCLINMILIIVSEMLELYFLTNVLNYSKDFIYNIFAGSIISNISISVVTLLITYIIKKKIKQILNIKIEENTKILIYFILTFICVVILFYNAFINIRINASFIATIFLMLTFLTILISLIKQTLDNNKLTKEYDKLLEFMTTYENEIENQRILRHETKNEFLTIRAKICDKQENEEIINFIDEILNEKIKVNQEKYAKFGYLPPNGIKGLCYFKVQEAENKGIKVSLNISKKIKTSNIYKLDTKQQKSFGRIIGVILDNAIEASITSSDKQLGIEAYTNSEKEFKMIISNSYNNEVDSNKIGIERFSTKGKNRGHGLLLVKHIINDNKIFNLKTNIQDDIYTQIITIKNSID